MQTKVLKAVWGKQAGYVFIPRRKGKTWVEGKAYTYPDEWSLIKETIETACADGWDTYWCPLVFDKPSRLKENAKKESNLLWADLDFVDPSTLKDLAPTIAWASSDERFQGLWALDANATTEEVERVNRALTYHIGADKGGWDVTQVLRVPGSKNFKYSPPQEGRLLWVEKRYFSLGSVAEVCKEEMEATSTIGTVADIDTLLDGYVLPTRILTLLSVDPLEVVEGERSDRLWEIETALVEAGMPILAIVSIVASCPWNKFKGRRDEKDQIYREVLKADTYVKDKLKHRTVEITEEEREHKATALESLWAVPYDTFMSKHIDKPEWLVEGIWQTGTYGLIAGEPKTYKSVQATDLALSVASGRPFLNHFPVLKQGAVLYVQEENNEATIQDRVFKIAASKNLLVSTSVGWSLPPSLPIYFSNNYGLDLTNPDSRKLLEGTIKAINPILVILDPLYMMMGGLDENSSKEVGEVLRWLTYLRNRYGCALVVCHHYNKGSGGASRGGQRVRGSSAFHAWVESALYVKTTTEAFTIEIEREFRAFPTMGDIKARIELGAPGELHYKPSVQTGTYDILDVPKGAEEDRRSSKIMDLLVTPRTFDELKSLIKMTKTQLEALLKTLEEDGYIQKTMSTGGRGRRTTYILAPKGET